MSLQLAALLVLLVSASYALEEIDMICPSSGAKAYVKPGQTESVCVHGKPCHEGHDAFHCETASGSSICCPLYGFCPGGKIAPSKSLTTKEVLVCPDVDIPGGVKEGICVKGESCEESTTGWVVCCPTIKLCRGGTNPYIPDGQTKPVSCSLAKMRTDSSQCPIADRRYVCSQTIDLDDDDDEGVCCPELEDWRAANVGFGCVALDGSYKQPGDTWTEQEFPERDDKWVKVGYIHECQNKSDGSVEEVTVGCSDNHGTRRSNGAKWNNGNYVMQCVENEQRWRIVFVACVAFDGSYKQPGDTWTEQKFPEGDDKWVKVGYIQECRNKSNGNVAEVTLGCSDNNGTRRLNGAKWNNGDYVMQCVENEKRWRIEFVTCVASDGSYKQPGDTWTEQKFPEGGDKWVKVGYIHECQNKSNGNVAEVTLGCSDNNGTRRLNGAKWNNGDYVMQCVENEKRWRIVFVACVASDGSYKQPGDTWTEQKFPEGGDKWVKVGYIHECQNKSNGNVAEVTLGCSDNNGTRRLNGAKWNNGDYVMQCVENEKRWRIVFVACVASDGSYKQPGDTWTEQKFPEGGDKWVKVGYIHECQNKSNGNVAEVTLGCSDNNGTRRLNGGKLGDQYTTGFPRASSECSYSSGHKVFVLIRNGAKWDDGSYVIQCIKNGDTWRAMTVGCVASNGSYKENGDKWNDGSFIMQCVSNDIGWGVNRVGCITKSGERKNAGDKWVQGRYIFQCTRFENSIITKLIGCIEHSGTQHSFGETWSVAPSSPKEYGFVYKCTNSSSGGASIERSACAYNNAGAGFTRIDQGCYKKFSTNDGLLYVSCKKTATGVQYGTISGKKPNGEEKAC